MIIMIYPSSEAALKNIKVNIKMFFFFSPAKYELNWMNNVPKEKVTR